MKTLIKTKKFNLFISVPTLLITILFTASFITPLLILTSTAQASNPYEAADVLGQDGFDSQYPNNTSPSNFGFNQPGKVAVDTGNQRLFVADAANNRVLIYSLDENGELIDNYADEVLGQSDFDHTSSGIDQDSLNYPSGLAFDSGANKLFVVDRNNNRIMIFDTATITNGENAVNVLGQADFVTSTSDTNAKGFNNPRGAEIDEANDMLFITDSANHRVLVFDISAISDNEDAVNVLGQANFTTRTQDTNAKGFNYLMDVTYDETNDRLFAVEYFTGRVLVFDTSSISDNEDAVNVLGQADFVTDTQDTNAKGFDTAVNATHNPLADKLYVSERFSHRILVFDTSSISDNEDAVNVLGQDNFTSSEINNFSPNDSGFYRFGNSPTLDSENHRLFVTDSENSRILVFNLDSNNNLIDKTADYVIGQPDFASNDTGTGAGSLSTPGSASYDPENNLLFVPDLSSNCRVMVYDVTSITNGEDAVNILGGSDINTAGDCDTSQSAFGGGEYYGTATYDQTTEKLYVTDSANNYRIMVFDLSGGITDGMNASSVLGASDFDSPGAGDQTATGAYDTYPNLAIDSDNQRLFFASYNQSRTLVYDVDTITNGEPAVNVIGQDDFTTSDGTDQIENFGVVGLGYDPVQQLLFVAEYEHSRILIYDINSLSDGEDPIGVLGQPDFSSSGSDVSQTDIYPYSQANIAYDSINRKLWYGDDSYSRVLRFDFANLESGSLDSGDVGVGYSDFLPYSGTQGTKTFTVSSGSLPDGLSLNASTGALTGTPTTVGTSNFTISLSDDNSTSGTFTDSQSYTLTIELGDDLNDDGIADATQDNVVSVANPITGEITALEVGDNCSVDSSSISSEDDNATGDSDFSYPLGLMNFSLDCGEPGATTTVKQFYYNIDSTDSLARKYNPNTNEYFNIDGATIDTETIDSQTVTTLTFDITDGGALDTDQTEDGNITDPSGLATTNEALADTGINQYGYFLLAIILITSSSLILITRRAVT